jgi:hypothetical protein
VELQEQIESMRRAQSRRQLGLFVVHRLLHRLLPEERRRELVADALDAGLPDLADAVLALEAAARASVDALGADEN